MRRRDSDGGDSRGAPAGGCSGGTEVGRRRFAWDGGDCRPTRRAAEADVVETRSGSCMRAGDWGGSGVRD